jgi:hypothetical protein
VRGAAFAFRAGLPIELADTLAPVFTFTVDDARLLNVVHHFTGMELQFDFIGIHHAHEQGLRERFQILLTLMVFD